MSAAEFVPLHYAAKAFNIPDEVLLRLLHSGKLPEAVKIEDRWSVPLHVLPDIAQRERFAFDLTVNNSKPKPAATQNREATQVKQLERRVSSETMAAHAAIVLAKTQTTAARAETQELIRRIRKLQNELEDKTIAQENTSKELNQSRVIISQLDQQRGIAEARIEEIRAQLDQERFERAALAARYSALEYERNDLLMCLDWVAKRRLERRKTGQQEIRNKLLN